MSGSRSSRPRSRTSRCRGDRGRPNWQPGRLAWVDLKSTATTTTNGQTNPTRGVAWDYLTRTGDPHPAAAFPTWSRDGNSIVYVSVACPNPGQQNGCGTQDGRLYKGAADLYEIPYANKAGGAATPVAGASTPRPGGVLPGVFSRRQADRVHARAGRARRCSPTRAPRCSSFPIRATQRRRPSGWRPTIRRRAAARSSPGINNHWPKWSPDRATVGNKTYYWMIFSSNRYGLPPVTTSSNGRTKIVQVSQLYITAVVTDSSTASSSSCRSTPPSTCGTSRRAVSTRRLPGTISTFRSSSIELTIDAPARADRAKLRSAVGHGIPDQTQGAGWHGDPPHPAAAARARRRGGARPRRRAGGACARGQDQAQAIARGAGADRRGPGQERQREQEDGPAAARPGTPAGAAA